MDTVRKVLERSVKRFPKKKNEVKSKKDLAIRPRPHYSLRMTNTATKQTVTATFTKTIFACYTNTDLTEGRGAEYPFAFAEKQSTATRLAKGKGVQGTDARVQQVQMFFIPQEGCQAIGSWYAPAGYIHTPTARDLEEEQKIQNEQAKKILLEKFRNNEEISAEERQTILAMLEK